MIQLYKITGATEEKIKGIYSYFSRLVNCMLGRQEYQEEDDLRLASIAQGGGSNKILLEFCEGTVILDRRGRLLAITGDGEHTESLKQKLEAKLNIQLIKRR